MQTKWDIRAIMFFIIDWVLLSAQPDTLWTKTYGGFNGDIARCVQQTNDGGYILTGMTASYGAGDMDIYIIKTDSLGELLWTKTYGGFYNDGSEWIECTTDSGYIVAGTSNSYGSGSSDIWVVRINENGDTTWTQTYGGVNGDKSWSVIQTNDEGYVICGKTESYGAGGSDVWLIKTDSLGDTVWTQTYGGSQHDLGRSVVQTSDNCYIITGYTYSYGSGQSDIWLIKTDSLGDALWTRVFGGTDYDYAYQVVETEDHGYFITGMTMSLGNGHADAWFIRTDSLGDTLWTRTFGDTSYEYMVSGVQTADGGFIACGYTETNWIYDLWIIKLDSTGNCSWTKTLGHGFHEYGQSIRQTRDGGYICAGDYYYASGDYDIWLIRLAAETSIEENDNGNVITNKRHVSIDLHVHPNPFERNLIISYTLGSDSEDRQSKSLQGNITLKIFSASGRLVKQWDDKNVRYSNCIVWSGTDQNNQRVPAGVYFIQLESSGQELVEKVILTR
jgi:hypothetical protein